MSFVRQPRFKRFAQATPRGTPRNCWERDRQTDSTRQEVPRGSFLIFTYFCFSASFLCSKVSAKSALLSMSGSVVSAAVSPAAGNDPSLCSAGGTCVTWLCAWKHTRTWMGSTDVTHAPSALWVPLVPRSSGYFFQGQLRSFRGGFSGSRRWSSTGAGSAGNSTLYVRGRGQSPTVPSHLPKHECHNPHSCTLHAKGSSQLQPA